MRGVFFDEDHARQATARLLHGGFEASCQRQPLAGEDDDEDHPWVVQTDAPAVMLAGPPPRSPRRRHALGLSP